MTGTFKIGDAVVYEGKTYRFPGRVCGITDDGQIVVEAFGDAEGNYRGMKHIYGPSQIRALSAMPEAHSLFGAERFQARVQPWMEACFGAEISADRLERGDRLLEEVLELLQSGGYPRERIASLTDYVYERPAGEPAQEVGGVMVTLAAYCLAHGLDMHADGERELARVWTKVDAIRAKQAAKPTGSALPVAVDTAAKGRGCVCIHGVRWPWGCDDCDHAAWRAAQDESTEAAPLTFAYRNYKGVVAVRRVLPLGIRYGTTDWHPAPGWLLRAIDIDKGAERDFAMQDIGARDTHDTDLLKTTTALQTEVERLRDIAVGRGGAAARDVLTERRRQIEQEGCTPAHDALKHTRGELAAAAACYALYRSHVAPEEIMGEGILEMSWPWGPADWKPKNPRHDLVRAAALILAEIERIDSAPEQIIGEAR